MIGEKLYFTNIPGKTPLLFLFLIILGFGGTHAQRTNDDWQINRTARGDIARLASKRMYGRGYQNEGHLKAAEFITARFEKLGLEGIPGKSDTENVYFQPFWFFLNQIDEGSLYAKGENLVIGSEFIVNSTCGGRKAEGKVQDVGHGLPYEYPDVARQIVVFRDGLPAKVKKKKDLKEKYSFYKDNNAKINFAARSNAAGVVILKKKLTAGLSRMPVEIPVVEVLESEWPKKVKYAEIEVQREYKKIHSQNVIGIIPGKTDPDRAMIISAHYDHLGMQGDAVFAGANDNASGIAMLLSMAEHYMKPENRPDISLVFIGFGAEEVGLIGSRHYVENDPVFPLEKTEFVLNLDLMGNGDEGITAVAGLDFEDKFQLLDSLNDTLKYVPVVKGRRNAPNSDHYFFVTNEVEGFFIYTLGGKPHYHDIYDVPRELRLSKFIQVRKLLIAFTDELFKGFLP